jgi:flagella basal body P-ring formation protein FlgA
MKTETNSRALFPRVSIAMTVVCIALHASGASRNVSLRFKSTVTVNDTVIRLQDIASVQTDGRDIREKLEQTVIGAAAPPGYSRYINTHDMLTYTLKPLFSDMTFTCGELPRIKAGTDHAVHTVGEFEKKIIGHLRASVGWNPQACSIAVTNPNEEWRCLDKPCSIDFSDDIKRNARGRVRVYMIATQGSRRYRVPVSATITVSVPVLCAREKIERGVPLSEGMFEKQVVDITRFRHVPLRDFDDVVRCSAARTIPAHAVIHRNMVKMSPHVYSGQQVLLNVARGPISISVAVRARESGNIGDRIWVEYIDTHTMIQAVVIENGKVKLES